MAYRNIKQMLILLNILTLSTLLAFAGSMYLYLKKYKHRRTLLPGDHITINTDNGSMCISKYRYLMDRTNVLVTLKNNRIFDIDITDKNVVVNEIGG